MESPNLPNDIIERALLLHDEGASVSDILEKFPEHRTELEGIFGLISEIRHEGRQIPLPSRTALETAIQKIATPSVTASPSQRYPIQEVADGPSYIIGIFNSFESLMKMHWKIVGSLGTVAVVALIFFAGDVRQTGLPQNDSLQNDTVAVGDTSAQPASLAGDASSGTMMMSASFKSAQVTGDVDEAVDAFLTDASIEQAAFDADASLILASTDAATLNEFNTTIASYEY